MCVSWFIGAPSVCSDCLFQCQTPVMSTPLSGLLLWGDPQTNPNQRTHKLLLFIDPTSALILSHCLVFFSQSYFLPHFLNLISFHVPPHSIYPCFCFLGRSKSPFFIIPYLFVSLSPSITHDDGHYLISRQWRCIQEREPMTHAPAQWRSAGINASFMLRSKRESWKSQPKAVSASKLLTAMI